MNVSKDLTEYVFDIITPDNAIAQIAIPAYSYAEAEHDLCSRIPDGVYWSITSSSHPDLCIPF